jgi:hypothetical protein
LPRQDDADENGLFLGDAFGALGFVHLVDMLLVGVWVILLGPATADVANGTDVLSC